jgi:hypothetical protein
MQRNKLKVGDYVAVKSYSKSRPEDAGIGIVIDTSSWDNTYGNSYGSSRIFRDNHKRTVACAIPLRLFKSFPNEPEARKYAAGLVGDVRIEQHHSHQWHVQYTVWVPRAVQLAHIVALWEDLADARQEALREREAAAERDRLYRERQEAEKAQRAAQADARHKLDQARAQAEIARWAEVGLDVNPNYNPQGELTGVYIKVDQARPLLERLKGS